jgi:NTP pyrophosphatase (non-canonical NTP hydrolase)
MIRYREFTRERDWEQFHDPRSLILALVGEVGELAELFQWPTEALADASIPGSKLHTRASEELSDVLLYLVRLADVLNVEIVSAAQSKLAAAEERFPTEDFLGIAPDKSDTT